MTEVNYPYAKATPQHRLGAIILDAVFCILTLYIGYFIWALIVWGQGQTPGKQIVKIRVYSSDTGRPASWGHMAVRQLLIPITFSLIFWIPLILLGGLNNVISDPYSQESISQGFSILLLILYLLAFVLQLTDAFWILKGNGRHRLTDLWAKTDVLNESIPV